MDIKIRKATPNDFVNLPAIEKEAAQAFAEAGFVDIAEMDPLPASFYDGLPPAAIILVAEQADKITGFCVVIKIDGEAHLKELSVSYNSSGKGIGKALLQQAVHEAYGKDYQAMTLTTFADLPFNAPFYQHCGFKAFIPDKSWPELRALHEKEKRNELAPYNRIVMLKTLGGAEQNLQE